MPRRILATAAASLAVGLTAGSAQAQVDVRALLRAHAAADDVSPAFRLPGTNLLSVLVELPEAVPAPRGMTRVAPGVATFTATPSAVFALAQAHPDWPLSWAPPRHPLIDHATQITHTALYRNLTGESGKGAVVGIVDTGFDPKHPDLRDANGKTRVAWVLDLSRQPAGKHPDLEAEYGCTGESGYTCAILSADDVDELIAQNSAVLPHDTLGHGTHVASLAAGNGLSQNPPRFMGVAPEATLIAARVTRGGDSNIQDPDVMLATRFVFDRAKELGKPAVVNLSLGSDFGGHDGLTTLERGLASFVGAQHPGRAIVVAAGNSGGVYAGLSASYPAPFGIYTEVHVPRDSSVRVPILSPDIGKSTTHATIYVWIAGRPGDDLEVGVDDADGSWVSPLAGGESGAYEKDGARVSVLNQTHGDGSPIAPGSNGAVVVLEGTWATGKTFGIRLEGHGTARLWVQSDGDLSPGLNSTGALFPRASKEGTIGIPASSPALIAVGATINRLVWTDRNGEKIGIEKFGASSNPQLDSTAYFSGSGPNALGQMKPDISAPGAFVVGAMSALADPSKNGSAGIFGGGSACGAHPGCMVVDDFHAIATGTSMAAPIVSGAVALLLARDPSLTQPALLSLLQAGARMVDGDVVLEQQLGPGELDLVGSLAVMNSKSSPLTALPTRDQSWLALAASYAHPDPTWPLAGVIELRAADDGIADGFDPSRLGLEVDGGSIEQGLTRVAPGLWSFAVVARAGSGGDHLALRVSFDGQLLLERSVAIAVDRWVASSGADARGGCSTDGRSADFLGFLAGLALLSIARARRRNQAPR